MRTQMVKSLALITTMHECSPDPDYMRFDEKDCVYPNSVHRIIEATADALPMVICSLSFNNIDLMHALSGVKHMRDVPKVLIAAAMGEAWGAGESPCADTLEQLPFVNTTGHGPVAYEHAARLFVVPYFFKDKIYFTNPLSATSYEVL